MKTGPFCKSAFILLSWAFSICLSLAEKNQDKASAEWKEDFDKTIKKGKVLVPEDWENRRTKWTVPPAKFNVEKNKEHCVLKVRADRASGMFLCNLSGIVDLKKTPVLRWRWKAMKLPKGADGRGAVKDDQAVAIYIGAGKIAHKAIAYRWETETPKGVSERITFAMGALSIKWQCVRNKTDKLDKWYVEERNIAKDFKKAFGYIPEKFAISIAANSQHTGSKAEAEIDWIEFVQDFKN